MISILTHFRITCASIRANLKFSRLTFFTIIVVPRPIAVGGSLVEQVSSFKLLGVHVSEDLTWTVHIDWSVKRANRRLFS